MALDDDIALLRRLDFFDVFEADQLRLMLFAADKRVLRPNEILFSRGEAANDGYLVQSGLIHLLDDSNALVEQARSGTLIGEYALLAASERQTHAVALEKTSIIVLPRRLILRLLAEYPDVAVALREKLAARADGFKTALDRIAAQRV
jgi:CRP-like cAMP-binding protein